MKFLVDANVLSEVTRPAPFPAVVEWLRKHEPNLVVTPIVLGEIEYGIGLTASLSKRKALQHQLTIVTRNIGDFRNAGVPLMNPFDQKMKAVTSHRTPKAFDQYPAGWPCFLGSLPPVSCLACRAAP